MSFGQVMILFGLACALVGGTVAGYESEGVKGAGISFALIGGFGSVLTTVLYYIFED